MRDAYIVKEALVVGTESETGKLDLGQHIGKVFLRSHIDELKCKKGSHYLYHSLLEYSYHRLVLVRFQESAIQFDSTGEGSMYDFDF